MAGGSKKLSPLTHSSVHAKISEIIQLESCLKVAVTMCQDPFTILGVLIATQLELLKGSHIT